MNVLGTSYLDRFGAPLVAYNRLQSALMRRFVRRGGSFETWMAKMAPAFRNRYGWMCGGSIETFQPALIPTTTPEQELRRRIEAARLASRRTRSLY